MTCFCRGFACPVDQDRGEVSGLWYGVDAEVKGEHAGCSGIDVLVDT